MIENLDEEVKLIKKGTLTKFSKEHSKIEGTRIKDEAKELFGDQLEQLAIVMFRRAEEITRCKSRKTIFPEDFEEAYEELMQPHVFIEEIVNKLEEQKSELKEIAENSMLRHMEVY
ncbi:histone-like protein [Amphibacillus jilinensis]|uniref:histone-like protein n=1 Tax=Amphibacillus jilinensis TaxID=1216008 RepID=UPI0002E322A1|nr:histone-like protein [Amphibacillus jilinensis]